MPAATFAAECAIFGTKPHVNEITKAVTATPLLLIEKA